MFVAILKGLAGSAADPWISDLVSQGWQWYGHPDGSSDYDPQTGFEELGAYGLNEPVHILGAFGADHKPVPHAHCVVVTGSLPPGVVLSGVNDFAPDGEYRYSCRFTGTPKAVGDFHFTATPLDPPTVFAYHMTVIPRYAQGKGTTWGSKTIDD